jgi:hypothetical protein
MSFCEPPTINELHYEDTRLLYHDVFVIMKASLLSYKPLLTCFALTLIIHASYHSNIGYIKQSLAILFQLLKFVKLHRFTIFRFLECAFAPNLRTTHHCYLVNCKILIFSVYIRLASSLKLK